MIWSRTPDPIAGRRCCAGRSINGLRRWVADAPGQDGDRILPGLPAKGSAERVTFDFLGVTFALRGAREKKDEIFTSFMSAVNGAATKRMGREFRSWQLHHATTLTLEGLAQRINPIVRGWMNHYRRVTVVSLLMRINTYLVRWSGKKFKRLHGFNRASNW